MNFGFWVQKCPFRAAHLLSNKKGPETPIFIAFFGCALSGPRCQKREILKSHPKKRKIWQRPHRSPTFLLKIAFLQGFYSKNGRAKMRKNPALFWRLFFGVESILFICFIVTLLQRVAYIRSFACDRSLQTTPFAFCGFLYLLAKKCFFLGKC